MIVEDYIYQKIDKPLFHLIGETADELGLETYVVGGFVRDLFLSRPSKDIDVVSVGRGIELAEAVAKHLKGSHLSVFARFGTAQVKYKGTEIEFVGARRESYSPDSRKPVVEDGSLQEDQERRDFTINALAICLNKDRFGELLDPFDGLKDMDNLTIRTPLDPDITFSDDPLRMMRAIRFASQLGFFIQPDTFAAIARNAHRIEIISGERIITELNKILLSPKPSIGLELFELSGLMALVFPELLALKGADTRDGIGHKDNLTHTYKVVDNLAKAIRATRPLEDNDLWLLWSALVHDIGKPRTKKYDARLGWTFHNHEYIGAKMLHKIFKRLKLPLDGKLKYVRKLVELHMRPAALVDEGVTDSAVRRLLFDAGDDLEDLMMLVEADITSKNPQRVRKYLDNYVLVRKKLKDIEEKDRIRNFQPPIDGLLIMETFGIGPCHEVGLIKETIKNAILDGLIPNEYEPAYTLMLEEAHKLGLSPKK